MKYVGLRLICTIKESFRSGFEKIARYGCWQDSEDERFKAFSNNHMAYCIPCGPLNNMPDTWDSWNNSDFFVQKSYSVRTGFWFFNCSICSPFYSTLDSFFKMIPYFVEKVYFCEVYKEGEVSSLGYGLVDGEMRIVDSALFTYCGDGTNDIKSGLWIPCSDTGLLPEIGDYSCKKFWIKLCPKGIDHYFFRKAVWDNCQKKWQWENGKNVSTSYEVVAWREIEYPEPYIPNSLYC